MFVSVCSKCSRLQQPSQHISDEPELQHPARLLDTVDSAARTRDVAALFSRSRGCCDCSKTQTHPESRWVRVTFSALACFIVVPSGSTQGGAEINTLFLKNTPFKFQILFLFHFLHCSMSSSILVFFFWQWGHREEKVFYCRCGNVPEMLMFLQICLQVQI